MNKERHALRRTSPKGGPFIGTCTKCGQASLTLTDMASQNCVNPGGLSQDDALLLAIKDVGAIIAAKGHDHAEG